MSNEKKIWDFLISKGLSPHGAAGLMGNLYAESGLIPNNLENTYSIELKLSDAEYTKQVDDGVYLNFIHDKAGYGLAQWTFWTRKQNLLNYAKANHKSIGDLTMQLEFLIQELREDFPRIYNVLKTATTVQESSDIVLMDFERPANAAAKKTQRTDFGMNYYNKYAKGAEIIMAENTYIKGQGTQLSKNFKSTEFDCHGKNCCSSTTIDPKLVEFLQKIRDHFGTSLTINSGYRCPTHNKNIGGASKSNHMYGKAADIVVKGITPKQVAQYAESIGVKGIGVYKTFTHIDTRTSKYFWYDGGASNVATFGEATTNPSKPTDKPKEETSAPKKSILQKGNRGNAVKLLQQKLLLLGYDLGQRGADGDFGSKTHNAVNKFQESGGLTTDGLVGSQTQNALSKNLVGLKIQTTANLLNVRSGPSLKHPVIRILKRGSVYTIIEEKDGWAKLNSLNGWVSLDYIQKYV